MIIRYENGRVLIDRDAASELFDRSADTIRAKCKPVTYDEATGRALYDADQIAKVNDIVKRNLATIDPARLANLRNLRHDTPNQGQNLRDRPIS